jgi:HSP20 family protein
MGITAAGDDVLPTRFHWESVMANIPMTTKQTKPMPTSDGWQNLRAEMDQLFDRFSSGLGFPAFPRLMGRAMSPGAGTILNTPAVDVTEDANAYKVTAELPGMSEKDVELSLSGDLLTLRGEKRDEKEEKSGNRYISERTYGSFQRSFTLPDGIDRAHISADFAKGVLTVMLPKTQEAKKEAKKIEVKAAG